MKSHVAGGNEGGREWSEMKFKSLTGAKYISTFHLRMWDFLLRVILYFFVLCVYVLIKTLIANVLCQLDSLEYE